MPGDELAIMGLRLLGRVLLRHVSGVNVPMKLKKKGDLYDGEKER
jgi:hypothetical protein